jgi:hypothetical protein
MSVDRVGHSFSHRHAPPSGGVGRGIRELLAERAGSGKPALRSARVEQPEPSAETGAAATLHENPLEKGVLRLLASGHFKGVADVRLRINFFDELAAAENQRIGQAAEVGLAGIADAVKAQLTALLEGGTLTDEQVQTILQIQSDFLTAGNQIAAQYPDGVGLSVDAVATQIQSAFDALRESLRGLLLPLTTEQPSAPDAAQASDIPQTPLETAPLPSELSGDGEMPLAVGDAAMPAPESESATAGASVYQAFLDGLDAAFAAAFDAMLDTLGSARLLPELSQPSGNGVAYAKFLAVYRDLRGEPDDGATAPETTVNALI